MQPQPASGARFGAPRLSPAEDPRFLVDAMLGNVARELRLLGYDAAFERDLDDGKLLRAAQSEARILVTRDRALAARAAGTRCVLVTTEKPSEQALQVLSALALLPTAQRAYSRCLTCNHPLTVVTGQEAEALVPDHIVNAVGGFLHCPSCTRVYWKGSHSARLDARIRQLIASLHPAEGQV